MTTPTGCLGATLEPRGHLRLEQDQRDAEDEQRTGVAGPPPGAEPGGAPHVPAVRGYERGNGDEVVGVGCVPGAEDERDPEDDGERRSGEQALEPHVDGFDEPVEKLEIHQSVIAAATAAWP